MNKSEVTNHLSVVEKLFWRKLYDRGGNVSSIYPFTFVSLYCDVRVCDEGFLNLCYKMEKKKKSIETEFVLIEILEKTLRDFFGKDHNQKYIGFYKLESSHNYRNVLSALFIMGNEKDIHYDDKKFLLGDDDTCKLYRDFSQSGLSADVLFENYISDTALQFNEIALQVKEEIYKNSFFVKISSDFTKTFPVFEKRD